MALLDYSLLLRWVPFLGFSQMTDFREYMDGQENVLELPNIDIFCGGHTLIGNRMDVDESSLLSECV